MAKVSRFVFAAVTTIVLGVAVGVGPASAEPAAPASGLTAQQEEFILSDAPKTVTLDATTGRVTAVEKGIIVAKSIVVRSLCKSGDACWGTDQIPYANIGFGGTGTVTGSWPARIRFDTNSHTSKVCWDAGVCGVKSGPNTTQNWSRSVTGKKVVNYS